MYSPQHRAERRPAIASAVKMVSDPTLELNVAADPVRVDHLAKQDGAAITELRHEMTELVAGIGHRNRVRPVRNALAGEDLGPLRASEPCQDRGRGGSRADGSI